MVWLALYKSTKFWNQIADENVMVAQINSIPNDNILGFSKSKAFADDIIKVTENLKFDLWRVENIVGKGENAGYSS